MDLVKTEKERPANPHTVRTNGRYPEKTVIPQIRRNGDIETGWYRLKKITLLRPLDRTEYYTENTKWRKICWAIKRIRENFEVATALGNRGVDRATVEELRDLDEERQRTFITKTRTQLKQYRNTVTEISL